MSLFLQASPSVSSRRAISSPPSSSIKPERVVERGFGARRRPIPTPPTSSSAVEFGQIAQTAEREDLEEAGGRDPGDGRAGLRGAGAGGDHAEALQAAENVATDVVAGEAREFRPRYRLLIGDGRERQHFEPGEGRRRPGVFGPDQRAKRLRMARARAKLIAPRDEDGCGTPRERAEAARNAFLFVIRTDSATGIVIIADIGGALAMLAVIAAPEPD